MAFENRLSMENYDPTIGFSCPHCRKRNVECGDYFLATLRIVAVCPPPTASMGGRRDAVVYECQHCLGLAWFHSNNGPEYAKRIVPQTLDERTPT